MKKIERISIIDIRDLNIDKLSIYNFRYNTANNLYSRLKQSQIIIICAAFLRG
jgi:hypothetical protein